MKEKFLYSIARPWDVKKSILEPNNMCIYTYGNEMHTGTIKSAESLLEYVQGVAEREADPDDNPKDYVIIKFTPEVVSPEKKKKK